MNSQSWEARPNQSIPAAATARPDAEQQPGVAPVGVPGEAHLRAEPGQEAGAGNEPEPVGRQVVLVLQLGEQGEDGAVSESFESRRGIEQHRHALGLLPDRIHPPDDPTRRPIR